MIRLFRATSTAAVASALAVTGLTTMPAQAVERTDSVNTTLCPGTDVWTGDIADEQAVTVKTTIKGSTPTTLDGTYVGRINDQFGNDILLFDVSGKPVTKTDGSVDAGIWSGMSGSPVNDADGNLIGAVAYSFTSSAASSIAGVTPAADMLTMGQDDPVASRVAVSNAIAREADVPAGTRLERMSGRRVLAGAQTGPYDFAGKAPQLKTSGPLGTATLADLAPAPFVPGGNIAASWTSGSLLAASVGTVTAVCGDKVFAFGHPDESNGDGSNQTIHHASTVAVLPDHASSYKMVQIDKDPVGSLIHDGNSGIVGQVGRSAKLSIPVTTSVTRGTAPMSTSVTKVSEPMALSYVTATQVFSGLAKSVGNASGAADVTTRLTIKLRGENGTAQTVTRRVRTAVTVDALATAAEDIGSAVEMLAYGSNEEVRIETVAVATTVNATKSNGYKISGVEYRTGRSIPSNAAWKTATSRISVKKGHKLQVRYLLKKVGSPTTVVRTPAQSLTTSSKFTSAGTIEGIGASTSGWDEDEYYYEDDELTLKEAVAAFKTAPSNEAVRSSITYRAPSTRRAAANLLTNPAVFVSGYLSVPVTFTK